MALPYKKWTEDEIRDRNVSPEGNYPFKVIAAILKKTKGGIDKDGNVKSIYDMLEVDFEYHDINGVVKKQKDWFVFCEGMDWKLRHLADSIGLIDLYDADDLDQRHLPYKTGVFTLGVKDFKGEANESKKVNFIKDYVKSTAINLAKSDQFIDDDIPL
jgi:hypothetical protein